MRIWDLDNDNGCCDPQISIVDLDTGEAIDISFPPQARAIKAGTVAALLFSGSPLIASVAFANPFMDTSYVVTLTGKDARVFTYQSKTVDGFVINANSDEALTGEVSWTALTAGETS